MIPDHTLTIRFDEGITTYAVVCGKAKEAPCHAWFDCDCESRPIGGTEDGRPWHEVDDDRHMGVYLDKCTVADWLEMDPEEYLRGEISVPCREEWDWGALIVHVGEAKP